MNFPNKQRGQFSFNPAAFFIQVIAKAGFSGGNPPGPVNVAVLKPFTGTPSTVGFTRRSAPVLFAQIDAQKAEEARITAERVAAAKDAARLAFPGVEGLIVPLPPPQLVTQSNFTVPPTTQSVLPALAPDVTPAPAPAPEEERPVSNGFELIPFLSGVANVFGSASELGSVIRGPVAAPSPAPSSLTVGLPAITRGVGMATNIASGFLGFGGNGAGTPLSRARDSSGRRPSRRQVITAARVCGLDVAAQTYGLSLNDLCSIVAKGMPRRSRGISSADMRRTRSTLRKMSTMRKTLRPLCR